MKKIVQAAIIAATLTAAIAPGLAQARPWHHHHHQVCMMHHHHRVCTWR